MKALFSRSIVTLLFVSAALFPLNVLANDSEAGVSIGGLVLKNNNMISMDSEDLYISANKVRVKYRFTNNSSQDATTLIAFPLPDYEPLTDEWDEERREVHIATLDFETKVDGKAAKLSIAYIAKLNGKDISADITQAGLPIDWFNHDGYSAKIKALDADTLTMLTKKGVIAADSEGVLRPRWTTTPNITRQQTFPAKKSVIVEHSYIPQNGGSVGGSLLSKDRDKGGLGEYYSQYCIDKSFLSGFDAKMAEQAKLMKAKGEETYGAHSETWIGYVLKSGANWKGPIKDFRLVIDKGEARNLVSFCMDGVKKISPTQFEVRKTNFEPSKDLNILIINIPDPKEL